MERSNTEIVGDINEFGFLKPAEVKKEAAASQ